MDIFRGSLVATAIVAAILMTAGVAGVASTREGIESDVTIVDGTPIELIRPAWAITPVPGVVVVHGFSGSRQVMYGIGQTLARNGFAAALIDLPGHGANPSRMGRTSGPGRAAGFDAAVASAIRWLRTQPGVAADRIALVGHSMGAAIVVRYATLHPDVVATVAISGVGGRPEAWPDRPRNLLTLAGGWEFGAIRRNAVAAVRASHPNAEPGQTVGDVLRGTARRVVIVPRVEHIGIIFSRQALDELVTWIRASTGMSGETPPTPAVAMPWVLLIYAGVALGFIPLAWLAFAWNAEPRAPAPPAEPRPAWRRPILLAASVGAAALVAPVPPAGWLPLMTADYLVGFFLTAGLALLAATALQYGRFAVGSLTPGLAWRTALLALYALIGFGVTAQFTWLDFQLVGDRQWLVLLLFPVWVVYFLGDELWHGELTGQRRLWAYLGAKLLTVGVLLGSAFVGGAPFFLLLLAPALVPLFLLHAFYSYWLNRFSGSPLPAAIINAMVFAWAMAAVFPLV
ncbi:MAG: alpha/beta fold hydrolase [Acidobacteria bacterium]|nr:alpha/beta fold hydrolase [Acidobacteriota bacterium]